MGMAMPMAMPWAWHAMAMAMDMGMAMPMASMARHIYRLISEDLTVGVGDLNFQL